MKNALGSVKKIHEDDAVADAEREMSFAREPRIFSNS